MCSLIAPGKLSYCSVSGFSFDLLSGKVDSQEKQQIVDRFQDLSQDYFILLATTQAGGVGLNLTAVCSNMSDDTDQVQANKVVIFDPSWSERHRSVRSVDSLQILPQTCKPWIGHFGLASADQCWWSPSSRRPTHMKRRVPSHRQGNS